MTCIVGIVDKRRNNVVMACDSQANNGGAVLKRKVSKIHRIKFQSADGEPVWTAIFGAEGDASLRDAIIYLHPKVSGDEMRDPHGYLVTVFVPWLRKWCVEEGRMTENGGAKFFPGMLLVAINDRLFVISSEGAVVEPECGYWAIGSGGAEARGAIHALMAQAEVERSPDADAVDLARLALSAACALDDGCSPPVFVGQT